MNCKRRCQEFMNSVSVELEDEKGVQREGITEEEILDLLEYLFS